MKIIKTLKEYATLVTALLLFFFSPYLLRWIDPTAGAYDAGVLQVIIMTLVQFCVYQAFVWFTINLIWPGFADYFKTEFINDFKMLEKWQKICFSLCAYFLLFLLLAVISRVI